jgi:PAS domain S-box-containing protein
MTLQSVPQAIPIGFAAACSAVLTWIAWRRRSMPAGRAFLAMMAGETVWAASAAIEPVIVELPIKVFWIDLRVAGTLVAILGLMAFVFRFTGKSSWATVRPFALISAPAVTLVVLVWTNPWHHLYFRELSIQEFHGAVIAARSLGPGFWGMIVYCYSLAALATVLLIQSVILFTGIYRAQAAAMLFGVLLPWTVDALDTVGVLTFVPVDLVSMSFAVTGLCFLPALYWFRLLDLTPVAWAAVVKLMDDPVIVIDTASRIAAVNPSAQTLIGRTTQEILGGELGCVLADWPDLAQRLKHLSEDQDASFEIDRPGSDRPTTFNVRVSRLGDARGTVGWALVLRDITDLKRASEQQLTMLAEQAARVQAEAASRAKDRFLATLSHELRTPLTPILATVTEMLDDPASPVPLRPVLDMIHRNIVLEARLIDDLLDVTRIEHGKLHLKRETVDAHELIDRVLDMCGDDIREAHLTLVSRLKAEVRHVDADPARFQQVIWNLLKNAIKFSLPEGTIAIGTRNRIDPGEGTAATWLEVEVVDRGVGIEPELLPRIFNLFEQASPPAGRPLGGLGLGLSISRSIAEQHGGRLHARSDGAGRGATFIFELLTVARPAAASPSPPPPPRVIARYQPLRILMVEDNKDTLSYLSERLAKRGHDVRTAANLAAALRLADETEFELLICDIDLPDGSGLDLMEQLNSRGPLTGIALSGFGSAEDIDQSLLAGFAEHLTKPVEFRRLENAIREVTSGGPAPRRGLPDPC